MNKPIFIYKCKNFKTKNNDYKFLLIKNFFILSYLDYNLLEIKLFLFFYHKNCSIFNLFIIIYYIITDT